RPRVPSPTAQDNETGRRRQAFCLTARRSTVLSVKRRVSNVLALLPVGVKGDAMFTSLLNRFWSSIQKGSTRANHAPRPTHPRFRLEFLLLEGRYLPSTLMVTSLADSGPGTLRGQIAASVNGDTVRFDASLLNGTVNLTSGELTVNKDIRIEGPA